MKSFAEAQWSTIEAFRTHIGELGGRPSLTDASQAVCEYFATNFQSVVLARLFLVLPLGTLPAAERAFALKLANGSPRVNDSTRVLCLMGTSGKRDAWCDRRNSLGHLAIPLVSAESVSGAPMIAKLLSDLNIDLRALDDGRPIATRQMLGGSNGIFFVPDAVASEDSAGRKIVPATDFVHENGVGTVFGMGGAYLDGTLAVVVVFCNERLERLSAERFGNLIASFKMATSRMLLERKIF